MYTEKPLRGLFCLLYYIHILLMNTFKKHIEEIVKAYIAEFPDEFDIVRQAIIAKRSLTRDEFATLEGSQTRALYEIPERLSTKLINELDEEEMTWLRTLIGGRWFARKFRVFSLATKI